MNQCQYSKHQRRRKRRKSSSSSSFVVVHGAGSFGHHQAKQFGLQKNGGMSNSSNTNNCSRNNNDHCRHHDTNHHHRYQMQGLAQTRLSVQTLNRLVVAALIENSVNAVAISPCFSSIPTAAAITSSVEEQEQQQQQQLVAIVQSTLRAGLVPVLHGDACLFYNDNKNKNNSMSRGGILSGDTIIEWLGFAPFVSRVIFLTDVDGVYTSDPRLDSTAEFVPLVAVSSFSSSSSSPSSPVEEQNSQHVVIQATGSTHAHDVTGGFTTKLASAMAVAQTGKNVTIVKCGSTSAVQVISSQKHHRHDAVENDADVYEQPPPPRATVVYAPMGGTD
jgi:isopentenyl phosphate kinase